MTPSDDIATLTTGLRALEVLAHHAPLDVEAFARLSDAIAFAAAILEKCTRLCVF